MDSKHNTGWHVATRYNVRKSYKTFVSCVIMNQWGLILWWIRTGTRIRLGYIVVPDQKHCAPHIATVMNGSPRLVDMSVRYRVEYDRVSLWVYHTTIERKKITVYTVKLWDGAHNILKFAILNRNWRITDDRTLGNMSNRFKGIYS